MAAVRLRRRLIAAVVASAAVFNMPMPADAEGLSPRADEWWFRTWSIQDKVWPLTRGAGVTIAVLDYGVNAKLPELSGAIVPGVDLFDHSTDGRVDLDTDSPGHGTATSVQMVGQGGGTTGYVGIAPDAKVLPIRIPVSSLGGDVLANAITTAVDRGAKVVNMSFGQDSTTFTPVHCDPQLAPAISYALKHDVVLVAAAGNTGDTENEPDLPASCPGVLGVGGVTKELRPWKGTQRQNYVTIAAPGADMSLVDKHGRLHGGFGTSSASALTSAAIALIRAKNPGMPARTIVQRLFATARPIGAPGWNDRTGFGLLNIAAAIDPVKHPVPATARNPLYEAFGRWQREAPSVTSSPKSSFSSALPNSASQPRKSSSEMSSNFWEITVAVVAVLAILLTAGFGFLRIRGSGRRA
ncbi:S8 family serine peptidase [Actinomadura oligospora]|uniref:S8 family serine peptidase n=1 Tax=Actinomadura oligospora TaxID=111804 RepID=UPI0009FF4C8D|nr:S8 family serine peptidase [Actinomadura oligospora]